MLYIEFSRRHKKWSQTQLGQVTGIHQTFISEIERGVGLPTVDQQKRLASALDVPIDILLKPVKDDVVRGVEVGK